MTDIVERLTKYAVSSNDGNLRGPALDAAAEITRLRAKVAKADALAAHANILLTQGLALGEAREIVVGNLVSVLAAYRGADK